MTGAPARVTLRGGPDGWRCTVTDVSGGTEEFLFTGPEPARDALGVHLSDRVYEALGVDADVTWTPLDEPGAHEGAIAFRDPDPGRFPGRSPAFTVTVDPDRGTSGPRLVLGAPAAEARAALAAAAAGIGAPPPDEALGQGLGIAVGRARLSVLLAAFEDDGVDRVAEVTMTRGPAWRGSPELRPRLDGVELFLEPAADVLWLLRELGHEITEPRPGARELPALAVSLTAPAPDRPVTEARVRSRAFKSRSDHWRF